MKWYDNYPRLKPHHKVFLDSFTEDEYNNLVLKYYSDIVWEVSLSGKKVSLVDSVEWFIKDGIDIEKILD